MDDENRERDELERDLRQAIGSAQLAPHFQPLVELDTGRIVAFEALARWYHPVKGEISPAKFIPIAEECGLIGDLGRWILRQASMEACRWDPAITLSINVSPTQLRDPWLAERILGVLTETGLAPRRLEVEITENALVSDVTAARRILASLKNQGIAVSLDDFGAGYSSLHHLASMPFDRLKIDREFVQMLDSGDGASKIIDAIVGLGSSLGMAVIGEGVETSESAERLREAGCKIGQGWHFGRPMPGNAVIALLAEQGCSVARDAA
jgi:EAL domain-containing protein (putative c-di-GMP-specific phosphodiesterase class I)